MYFSLKIVPPRDNEAFFFGKMGDELFDGWDDDSITADGEETPEEESIYSYTQFYEEAYQNSTWVNKRVSAAGWNGEWARIKAGGQEFMMFGCGICCLKVGIPGISDTIITRQSTNATIRFLLDIIYSFLLSFFWKLLSLY